MGSARVSNSKPMPMENSDKKSIKTILKSIFNKKKDKKQDKKEAGEREQDKTAKNDITAHKQIEKAPQDAVEKILENFNKINLKDDKKDAQDNEDEDVFSFKVIEEEVRNERINSQTSEDSGFSEIKEIENANKLENLDKADNDEKLETIAIKNVNKSEKIDKTDEVIAQLENLQLEDEKKMKWQRATVSRGPIRSKARDYSTPSGPYPGQEADSFRQIHQINKHTLTGGQVIVNQCAPQENLTEVDIALKYVKNQAQHYQKDPDEYLEDVLEFINKDCQNHSQIMSPEYTSHDLPQQNYNLGPQDEFISGLLQPSSSGPPQNLIDNSLSPNKDELNTILFNIDEIHNGGFNTAEYIFPTPPRSENVPSPMLESPSSFYQPQSDCTLSPGSPIYNDDYENYQVIPPFEENKDGDEKKHTPSKTMKQFKDLQKEIAFGFSKKECCQTNRKSCKEFFSERMQKLKVVERKALCFKVAKLDAKTSFGVLHRILLSLSQELSCEQEDLQYALFGLVCVHILSHDAPLFAGDAGLGVLKSAALRCPHRPTLTRHLVQCIRTAFRAEPTLAPDKQPLFHEVDALGDNLVLACAREGDRCANVLAELVREEPEQPPLFRVHHLNGEGYTALHVACKQHSAGAPRLHTVHVLLEHAKADLFKGDIKGGDTSLHLAVNSANCDLQLIMLIFKNIDRKKWKSLAHCQNMSGVTPIEYARSANKSTTRQNYPPEVLDFLKKCR